MLEGWMQVRVTNGYTGHPEMLHKIDNDPFTGMNEGKSFRVSNKKRVLEAWVLGSSKAAGRPQVICTYSPMS